SYYSFGHVPSHIGRPNLQTTIETQHDFDGLVDQNISNRGKRQQLPSKYLVQRGNYENVLHFLNNPYHI
nr:hypothetical protein [Tanacetum cinerariifolium]